MPHRTQSQLALRGRIEAVIGVVAPLLDAMLFAGDKVSRIAGRNDIEPEPARRLGTNGPASIAGPAERD